MWSMGLVSPQLMWDLPRPGVKLLSFALEGRFLTIRPPGKSWRHFLLSRIESGRDCLWHLVGRCCRSSNNVQHSPSTTENYLVQIVNSAEVENLSFKGICFQHLAVCCLFPYQLTLIFFRVLNSFMILSYVDRS